MKDAKTIVQYGGDDFFIATSPSGHAVTVDVRGGRSAAPSPLEMLLVSLGACTGADVVSILAKKRLKVTSYRVELRGDRREEHPGSFRRIELRHILHGRGLTEQAVSQAIALSTDKYCSVAATIRPTAEIVTSYEILEEAG